MQCSVDAFSDVLRLYLRRNPIVSENAFIHDRKPHILAITDVNRKLHTKSIISGLNITRYQIFHNIAFQGERGVLLHCIFSIFCDLVTFLRRIEMQS